MKQFQCKGLRDRPYDEPEVRGRFPQSVAVLQHLPVGASTYDEDGDMWVRLPDVTGAEVDESGEEVEAPAVTTALMGPDERLERMVAAALQGLLAGCDADTYPDPVSLGTAAVDYARATIAALYMPDGNPFEAGL